MQWIVDHLVMECLDNNTHSMSKFCLEAWNEGRSEDVINCFPEESIYRVFNF